jgi:hypothetical protein
MTLTSNNSVSNQVYTPILDQLRVQVYCQIYYTLWNQLRDQVRIQLHNQQLWTHVYGNL